MSTPLRRSRIARYSNMYRTPRYQNIDYNQSLRLAHAPQHKSEIAIGTTWHTRTVCGMCRKQNISSGTWAASRRATTRQQIHCQAACCGIGGAITGDWTPPVLELLPSSPTPWQQPQNLQLDTAQANADRHQGREHHGTARHSRADNNLAAQPLKQVLLERS